MKLLFCLLSVILVGCASTPPYSMDDEIAQDCMQKTPQHPGYCNARHHYGDPRK